MINIIYKALPMRAQAEKTTSAKLYIYIEVRARDLYIDEAHTVLDIFSFAAFFQRVSKNKKSEIFLVFKLFFTRSTFTLEKCSLFSNRSEFYRKLIAYFSSEQKMV